MQELQRPIEYREVPERRNCDRTRPVACDQTLAASDQLIVAPTVGTTGRDVISVRSVAEKRDFVPNRPVEVCGAEETYLGC